MIGRRRGGGLDERVRPRGLRGLAHEAVHLGTPWAEGSR